MIIARAPLRISLLGGGTDSPVFFNNHGGLCVSMTIQHHVEVCVVGKHEDTLPDSWQPVPRVPSDLLLLCCRMIRGVHTDYIDAFYRSNVNGGSGLGFSSALMCGLLKALYAYKAVASGQWSVVSENQKQDPYVIAKRACDINEMCYGREGVGFQDEFASAYGGMNAIHFPPTFDCEKIRVERLNDGLGWRIKEMLMLFRLPTDSISSDAMMMEVNRGFYADDKAKILLWIKGMAYNFLGCCRGNRVDTAKLGNYLHAYWNLKKQLTPKKTTPQIDEIYQKARDAGAFGGKVCGSGGGGYLLICAPQQEHDTIRDALGLPELRFGFETRGTTVKCYD